MTRETIKTELKKSFQITTQVDTLTDLLCGILEKFDAINVTAKNPVDLDGKKKFRYHNVKVCDKRGRIAHADTCECEVKVE